MAITGKKTNRVKLFFKKNASSYLFLLPFLILYFALTVFPIAQTIQISLSKWDMMSPNKPFVGLKNFRDLFFNDPLFWISVKATLAYIFSNVPLKIVIGLILALALNKKLPGKAFHRTAIFIPIVINIAAVGLLFQWIFNPRMGALNYYLQKIGLGPQEWLIKPTWTMAVVVLVSIWWSVAFNAIVFLAGLQSIPGGLYEAAKIDGANKRHGRLSGILPFPALRVRLCLSALPRSLGHFRPLATSICLPEVDRATLQGCS